MHAKALVTLFVEMSMPNLDKQVVLYKRADCWLSPEFAGANGFVHLQHCHC